MPPGERDKVPGQSRYPVSGDDGGPLASELDQRGLVQGGNPWMQRRDIQRHLDTEPVAIPAR